MVILVFRLAKTGYCIRMCPHAVNPGVSGYDKIRLKYQTVRKQYGEKTIKQALISCNFLCPFVQGLFMLKLPDLILWHSGGAGFSVQNFDDVEKYYCFALFPWDNAGLETQRRYRIAVRMILPAGTKKVPLVARAPASVELIDYGETGAGVRSVVVILRMNEYCIMA